MQDTAIITCPYCGQPNEVYVDYSGGQRQEYEEDCQVCCRPLQVCIEIHQNEAAISVKRSDE